MIADKLGYANITTTGQIVKTGPAGLFGAISTVGGGATAIYDGITATGTLLYSKSLTLGDVVHFGGNGIAAKNGIFVSATGTLNILYT